MNLDSPTIDQWYPHIHVVDINDDGLPDIVLRTNSQRFSPYNHSRSILLNRGNAHFVDASEVFIANTTAGVAVGDFDGDGHPDLLVPQSGDLLRKFTAAQRLSPTWFVD